MKTIVRIAGTAGTALLIVIAAAAQAQGPVRWPGFVPEQMSEMSFEVSGRYTAQRRPRVTVLDFEDNNTDARNARYGDSVEAMLVTFFKRKSQFVVVERQKINSVMEEKKRMQNGKVNLEPDDKTARELLEKIDAFVLGSVTLLADVQEDVTPRKRDEAGSKTDAPENASTDQAPRTPQEIRDSIRGPRIEVDAKLLSRFDGRIIAVAQRRGPVACLRSIVERLGIALEQEFLRPYYGELNLSLQDPDNARVFLTPILLDTALDEEKPPVERSSTVKIDSDQDVVEPWTTDPTTYVVRNLLSGWYSMRLDRPGYEEIRTDRARWEARGSLGKTELYDRVTGLPLDQADPELRRFVVHVDPLKPQPVDIDRLKFVFRKQGGSLIPKVKRQYIDADFTQTPQRVTLASKDLDINHIDKPEEYADDTKCDLFDEEKPVLPPYGTTYAASGQKFDFESFKGGDLIIEDYHGETVPVGKYQMLLWEPHFVSVDSEVTIHAGENKSTKTFLNRETVPLELGVTGARPSGSAILEGHETHHSIKLPLDFADSKRQPDVPVDIYMTSTNIPGLDGWQRSAALLPPASSPSIPDFLVKLKEPKPVKGSKEPKQESKKESDSVDPYHLTVKTRLGLAGRLNVLSRVPDPLAADLFIDRDILKILNLLLYGQEERSAQETAGGFWRRFFHGRPKSTTAKDGGTAASAPRHPVPSRDRDRLLELLERRLDMTDLLVLDAGDMAELQHSPEVVAVIERYLQAGGALFAFVSQEGDYGPLVGAPLSVKTTRRRTRRFELAPGVTRGIVPTFDKKKVKVKAKRALPELAELPLEKSWRVIAFTQGGKDPRIVERGARAEGGYVALWLDDPDSFYGLLGGTVPKVEEARRNVEEHILEWARYLMYRRYDKSGEERQRLEKTLWR